MNGSLCKFPKSDRGKAVCVCVSPTTPITVQTQTEVHRLKIVVCSI